MFFISRRGGSAPSAATRIRRPAVSPTDANVCAASSPFHLVHPGRRIEFRLLRIHAIYDLELMIELINELELMRAAKCRSKTFAFFSQSFARQIGIDEMP
ncbi:hypothetical protein [Burkholderia sp. Bp8992]|uniref:hypothetical protein n=1 Tax=Burkholderia sp. Bp8992 TaxID=2184554 RepID=UPI000F580ADC|nr:hypothetical protein [Burkholderia sp. Bp8992]